METRWRIELFGNLCARQEGTAERSPPYSLGPPGTDRGPRQGHPAHGEGPGEAETPVRVITRFQTKTGTLLAYLAYHRGRTHRREALVELLWPECEPAVGRNNLSVSLTFLRRQLEPPTLILADRTSVWLNPDAVTTDVAEFEDALQAAVRAGSSRERGSLLSRAVELYRGEFLTGYFADWILSERGWLAERYFQALQQWVSYLEQAGELEQALEAARRGVTLDPLREETYRDVMRLYAALGQPAAARRQYQELERLLQQELEEEPDAATHALLREIERGAVLHPALHSPWMRPAPRTPLPTEEEGWQDRQAEDGLAGIPRSAERLERPAGENRLVTVLFADMCRYVETTEALHPEDAAMLVNRLLQAMVDRLLKYEGQVDRFLGDGLLAVFGAHLAHEDDPERAIRAAMEIREAARRLGLDVRVGINTGTAYVGEIGSERHREVSVMGPAVNLAARLQEQAEPGQILIGEATYRQTRQAFTFGALSLALKGIARPVAAYMVETALPRPEKTRGLESRRTPLIGRERELAQLQDALAQVLQGRGQMVSLIGEAGVGKSRLLAELKSALGVGGWGLEVEESVPIPNPQPPTPPLWLEGRALELTMTAGYSVFVDLFRDYFAWRPEEDDTARGERLVAGLRVLVEQGALCEERAEEMGPLLGNLLSLRFGTDWDQRLKHASPEQIRYQTFLAIRDFLVALARGRPLVLVLEDLHWADSLSLDLISLLLEALPLAALFLLCVYRPERTHKCWHLGTIAARKCPERYTELPLRELTPPQSRQLVESLLTTGNLPTAVRELILEKSRGNPFFVEEVVRSLIASGLVYREGEFWRAREGIETITVPESVQSVIASRVDRLRPELQQVLQRAAVIGRLFRPRLLEQVAGRGQGAAVPSRDREGAAGGVPLPHGHGSVLTSGKEQLAPLLWELEEQDLVYQERVVPEEEYSFKHVLTQETIYQGILWRQRPLLHQQVGEAIEALYPGGLQEHLEQLAYHYERSGADEKAVEYLLKAGEKTRRAYLNDAAIGYFQRALERLERSGLGEGRKKWQLEALEGLAKSYYRAGRRGEEAEALLRQAIVVAREMGAPDRELVRLYFWVGDVVAFQSRYDEQIAIGEEGLALLGEDTESAEAALMNLTVASGHQGKGNEEKWREFTLRNAAFVLRLPYWEECLAVYDHIVHVYADVEKDLAAAMRWVQALRQKAEEHRDLHSLSAVHDQTGWLLRWSGDFPGAIAAHQQLLDLCARAGDLFLRAFSLLFVAGQRAGHPATRAPQAGAGP